ncbi:MAG: SDR family oxidoreductase [Gemmatimonadaceae bacterium]
MTNALTGKIALVTGGTRGIGRAISLAFARAGARVVVSSRKEAAVEETVAAMRGEGLLAEGIPANVGRLDEALALVDRAVELTGGVDIIVNNAAANPVYGPVQDTTPEAYAKIMDVNLRAPFEIAKRALPAMVARGGGTIINISSIGGISPEESLGIYSVSKAALISLTQVMAREWGHSGVRANAICPGLIKTHFSQALWGDDQRLQQTHDTQPIPRMGEPDDVAHMALFLASPASSFCTGGVYMVDGGYTI